MPRYPLIMKHDTYFMLYERAGKEHTSLGKLINRILDAEVRRMKNEPSPQDTMNPHCMTCEAFKQETQWCRVHMHAVKATDQCERYHR